MIKVNIVYKNESGETVKTDQRDVEVDFNIELTPADLQAAQDAGKTVDDLVEEKVLTELQSTLATTEVTPVVGKGDVARIIPGEAMEVAGPVAEPEADEAPPLVEGG